MKQTKPSQQHADTLRSDAFEGNLQRASLLPGEIAVRPPVSQDIRAATGTGSYSEPAGAVVYRRHLVDKKWPDQEHGHKTSGWRRDWWYWPVIATAMVLVAWAIIFTLSDGNAAALAH